LRNKQYFDEKEMRIEILIVQTFNYSNIDPRHIVDFIGLLDIDRCSFDSHTKGKQRFFNRNTRVKHSIS
jgi:hypothetical protein